MRVQVQTGFNQTQFAEQVAPLAAMLDARWNLDLVGRRRRTLVLVSKAGHCLNDLLYRQRAGQVPIQIAKIMSNHPDLEGMASFYGVPFENHVVLPHTKPDFEAEVLKAVREYDIELVVLARFMQILSPSSVMRWRVGPSTSTTRSCPVSRAPTLTGRRTPAESS